MFPFFFQDTLKQPRKRTKKLESVLKLEKTLNCDVCDFTTKYRQSLQNHLIRIHTATKVKCSICFKVFIGEQQLKVHQKKHKNVKYLTCSICGYNFKENRGLQRHVVKYHEAMKLQMKCTCDFCGIQYFSKQQMDGHMKHMHVGSFKCFFRGCTSRFVTFRNRRNHYLSYHNNDIEVRAI